MIYECKICGYRYDEAKESLKFSDLPEDWVCPVCGVKKDLFVLVDSPLASNAEKDKSSTPAASTPSIPSTPSATATASDIIVETLNNFGLRWAFGMVGHSCLGAADAFRKLEEKGKLRFISIRHEGAGAFACSAYGKLTGKPAACLTIAGPGSTNLATGLSDAKLDKSPVIALMGQIPSKDLGLYAFQELDLADIFKPIAVSQQTLFEGSNFAELAATAYRNSIVNTGVSQIILPDDTQVFPAQGAKPMQSGGRIFDDNACSPQTEIARAAAKIRSAERPIIIMGDGCFYSVGDVMELAEKLNCPVLTTYRAKGFISDTHPLACGVVGRSGTSVAAKFMSDCDLIIGLGMGFSRHTGVAKDKPVIQIDRSRGAIGRLRKVEMGLVGEISHTLPLIIKELSNCRSQNMRAAIAAEWKKWRADKAAKAQKNSKGAISQAAVCAALSEIIDERAIVSLDVGNATYAFGRYFEAKHQRMLCSWYLGSIGVGLPSAIGAWCATQEDGFYAGRKVVAVVGDGGLGQYLADWTTAVRNNMDIKCVVFNNSELGKISLEQRNANFEVWETKLSNPHFAEYSKICGGKGYYIDDVANLKSTLSEAFAQNGAVMIEIATSPEM